MKKVFSLIVLVVFTISFVAAIFVSDAGAIPPDTYECIDGKLWVCTWDYVGGVNSSKLIYNCHWAGPC
ncbi:MAG: hypothetical protein AB1483_10665 [Candidatus Zixiibacteriota bacterium]